MMNKVEYKLDLIEEIVDLSILGQLSDSCLVYGNPAIIEKVEVIKIDSVISKIRERKEYPLNQHRIIVKQTKDSNIIISDEVDSDTIVVDKAICNEISENLNISFTNSLKSFSELVDTIKYFKRGILGRIFNKKNPDDICNKLSHTSSGYNWIMISSAIYNEISNSEKFIKTIDSNKKPLIKMVGRINSNGESIGVYLNKSISDNSIYFGKFDSISAIFNKNIKIENFPSGFYEEGIEITTEYTFIHKNSVKRINVE